MFFSWLFAIVNHLFFLTLHASHFFLRVIMINRRYVYISLEFVLRKYAGVKYCFLIIAISVFSI